MDANVAILSTNLTLSTLLFWIVTKVYILPKLGKWQAKDVLLPIVLLEASRHLGLMFLASGATYAGMPAKFAYYKLNR